MEKEIRKFNENVCVEYNNAIDNLIAEIIKLKIPTTHKELNVRLILKVLDSFSILTSVKNRKHITNLLEEVRNENGAQLEYEVREMEKE